MDAVASIREANGPKGVAQERYLIQVPPNWIPACAGMTTAFLLEFSPEGAKWIPGIFH